MTTDDTTTKKTTGDAKPKDTISSLDVFGDKGGTNLTGASLATAQAGRTQDRGLLFGVISGGSNAGARLFTDPVTMLATEESRANTFKGFTTLLQNPTSVVKEAGSHISTTLASGNSEKIGSFFGSAAVNTAVIASAFRGTQGAVKGLGETRGFSAATKFETAAAGTTKLDDLATVSTKFEAPVALRTQMLQSVETAGTAATARTILSPGQFADDALRARTAVADATSGAGKTADLAGDLLTARPQMLNPGVRGTSALPELKFGQVLEGNTVVSRGGSVLDDAARVAGTGDDILKGRMSFAPATNLDNGLAIGTRIDDVGAVVSRADGPGANANRILTNLDDPAAVVIRGNNVVDDGVNMGGRLGAQTAEVRIAGTLDDAATLGTRQSSTARLFEQPVAEIRMGAVTKLDDPISAAGRGIQTTDNLGAQTANGARIGETLPAGARVGEATTGMRNSVSHVDDLRPISETTGPRSQAFAQEAEFVSARGQLAQHLDDVKARLPEPAQADKFARTLDDYAKAPSQQTFARLQEEWTQLRTQAQKAGVPDEALTQMQRNVEVAIGRESAAGVRVAPVERPVTIGEPNAAVRMEGNTGPRVDASTAGRLEQPQIRSNSAPVEQPTWKSASERIGTNLDDMRTQVRQSGGNVQVVDKLDDAVKQYSTQPSKTNLDNLNAALREADNVGPAVRTQVAEVRQSLMSHMSAEHAAIARIEASVTSPAGLKAARTISDDITRTAENMRSAGNVDDVLKESTKLEQRVTKYLGDELKAGRITADDAMNIQRSTRQMSQEVQTATTTALREQAAVPRFRVDAVDNAVATTVKGGSASDAVIKSGTKLDDVTRGTTTIDNAATEAVIKSGTRLDDVTRGTTRLDDVARSTTRLDDAARSTTTVDDAARISANKKIIDDAFGTRAPEYIAKVEDTAAKYNRILNAQDDAARAIATQEFRQSAGQLNSMVKEAGVSRTIADQLAIDVRASLQNARTVQVANKLDDVSVATNNFVQNTERAIREANVTETVRTQLRAQLSTMESHMNGATAATTQWGTNAGGKAILAQADKMEATFRSAGINFAPLRSQIGTVETSIDAFRVARQNASIGNTWFSPVREFALNHPIIGRPADFLYNSPAMHVTYMTLGVLEINKTLKSAMDAAVAHEQRQQAGSTAGEATGTAAAARTVETDKRGAEEFKLRTEAAVEPTVAPANKDAIVPNATEKVAPDTKEVPAADRAAALPEGQVERVADTTVVTGGTTVAPEVVAAGGAATTAVTDQTVLPRGTNEDATSFDGQAIPHKSGAFMSMPITPEEHRLYNRMMNGGLDVGFVYYNRGPGAVNAPEEVRPAIIANHNMTFRSNITDIPADRERPTNNRFDWKRTRLDPSSLGRPDGFYMSNPYMAAENRRIAGGGKQDQGNGNGTAGSGTFANKYPFLAATAENAKTRQVTAGSTAGSEDAEALNPDQGGAGNQTVVAGNGGFNNGQDPAGGTLPSATVAANAPVIQSPDAETGMLPRATTDGNATVIKSAAAETGTLPRVNTSPDAKVIQSEDTEPAVIS